VKDRKLNIAAFLHRSARIWGDQPALALGATELMNYQGLAAMVGKLAHSLRSDVGLTAGDRCAIAMSNSPEFALLKLACWHAGLCAVPINAKLHRKEFEFILSNSGARACFTSPDKLESVSGLDTEIAGLETLISTGTERWDRLLNGDPMQMAEVAPDDPAWLFYTSGTTGQPKGAVLTHRNLTSMTMNYFVDVDMIAPGECIIHCAPMSHGSGIYALPHIARGAAQVIPESGGFDPAEMLELLTHHKGASLFFAPTMIVRLLDSPALDGADTENLKTIIYGGGPMYVEDLLRGIDRLGQKFVQIYGQGEAPMTITGLTREMHQDDGHPNHRSRLGSVGPTRTDVEVRVVDDAGLEVTVGEVGEIICRGDVVMKGYWNNPEATAATLKDGWLYTGDMGAFDEDGFLTLKDRSKDMIISGGTNVYPREVEEVLLKHPGVIEASVVGKPHPEWGEEIVAFVVKRETAGVDERDLDQLCLDNIARFKRPKHYYFVEDLPKNNYGKILKTELRKNLENEGTA
jgi:long-chain acyl-CoA synthetase